MTNIPQKSDVCGVTINQVLFVGSLLNKSVSLWKQTWNECLSPGLVAGYFLSSYVIFLVVSQILSQAVWINLEKEKVQKGKQQKRVKIF